MTSALVNLVTWARGRRHRQRLGQRLSLAWAIVVVLAAAAAFWVPALRALDGRAWPAPLDDVYIHFGFARSLALGHPSTWIPGNGYSSGGTSLLYPVLLAPGWALGARGVWLGAWAGAVAVAALVDLARSLRRAVGPRAPLAPALPLLLFAVPVLDWSWFSGMEVAVLGAVLGRSVLAIRQVEASTLASRPSAQLRAGLLLVALPALRPETAPLALLLGVAVAHASGRLAILPALARAVVPTMGFLALQAAANAAFTGETTAAGAVRKLVLTDPYRPPTEMAIEVLRNLVRLRAEAFEIALGGAPFHLAPFALAAVAIAASRTRRLAIPLAAGGVLALLLVALNTTAPFQNLRYAAPSLAILLVLAWLGADRLVRWGRGGAVAACVLVAVSIVGPARGLGRQIDHFARASRNIAEQQVEVGRRLAALDPPPSRVFVGDAGAIPYVSGLPAIDGLGLGGYRGLPFARASVHGVPAVIELLERLPPAERPDVLAVYDGWWPGLVPAFGRRLFAVHITDNVICGGDEKVVYAADWSALGPPAGPLEGDDLDVLDLADLVDERSHALRLPGPRAGWVIAVTRALADGTPRFDAGRIVPSGRGLAFDVLVPPGAAPSRLVIRGDGSARLRLSRSRGGAPAEILVESFELPASSGDRWRDVVVPCGDVRAGDRVQLDVLEGEARLHRLVWRR